MEAQENLWLDEYRQGNLEALTRLVDHSRRPLFGFILKMTEGREDAEEIFQETWFRALKNLDSYRNDRFMSWMFRIAHNLIIDRARKAKPVVALEPRDDDAENPIESRLADPGIGPDRQAAGRELGTRLREAINRLPAEQKEVFLMRMEGDVSFKDIAKIQGISINTALGRMHYALAKLKGELAEDYASFVGA